MNETNDSDNSEVKPVSLIGELAWTIILPAKYSQGLGLKKADNIKVTQEEGKVIIEKA
jgi:formylmethanofuran dehydrogenase subunit D